MRQDNSDNREAQVVWNRIAEFWDSHVGEGDEFLQVLVWPATQNLLRVRAGERILDVACGNGLTCRRLAREGARVVGIDFSEEMLAKARGRTSEESRLIEYRLVDATDRDSLRALGPSSFDAILCNMALFDMAEIEPLIETVPQLLRTGGRFVFTLLHPCFNNPFVTTSAEETERDGEPSTVYFVKVSRYMTPGCMHGAAIRGQPLLHPYFHRSLSDVFSVMFRAGLAIDGFEERSFPPEHETRRPLAWGGHFSEIPPVVAVRAVPTVRETAPDTPSNS